MNIEIKILINSTISNSINNSNCSTIDITTTQKWYNNKKSNIIIIINKNQNIDRVEMNEWGLWLQGVSKKLKGDKDIVLGAVKNDGSELRFVSKEWRADREIVLEVVKNNGYALQYVSKFINT